MKKLTYIFALLLMFSASVQAQKHPHNQKHLFTVEQMATLKAKKLALALDLSTKQQQEIKMLFLQNDVKRRALHQKIKDAKKKGKPISKEEKFNFLNHRLDNRLAFKKQLKQILDKKQFEKFEKMAFRKAHKSKKRKKHVKRRKV